jgi:deazaflavin-dependent oxidoreductase (nitroreductase family)
MLDLRRPGLRRRLTLAVIRLHAVVYRVSGGRVLGRIAGMPVVLLTTTGRRSGRRRTTPLTYLRDGSTIVLVASAGGSDRPPAWARNLRARPEAEIRDGRRTRRVIARVADADERALLWPLVTATYAGYARYQARTTREIPLFLLSDAP